MAEQLTFDLPARPALGRGDFFVSGANRLAVAAVDGWRAWPGGKLVLCGPSGSGKTHLARVWASESGARVLEATALTGADIGALGPAIVVEDADTVAGAAAEEALLHVHNMVLQGGGRLLLTAAEPPARWTIALPDLASRMQGTTVARREPPDDALLAAVLVKLFDDRQVAVDAGVLGYIARRIDRSFAAAGQIVAELDAAALRQGRPITRPLAAALLDKPGADT